MVMVGIILLTITKDEIAPNQSLPELETLDLNQLEAMICQFKTGEKLAFKVESTVSVLTEVDQFSGVMSWEVTELKNGSAHIRAAFSDVVFSQQLTQPEERAESPEGMPFVLQVNPDCSISNQGFSKDWSIATRTLVTTLLNNFSFTLPLASTLHWKASTIDGLGNYDASFSVRSNDPLTILREKVNHDSYGNGEFFGVNVKLENSESLAVFDSTSPQWWQSVSGYEKVSIIVPKQQTVIMEQRFSLKNMSALFVTIPDLSWESADFTDVTNTPKKKPLENKYKSYEEAQAVFDNAINETPARFYYAARQLAAWLKENPDDVERVVLELLGDMDDNSRPTAFFALQLSGTDEARSALMELVDHSSLSLVDQARAASALADISKPARDAVDKLLERSSTADIAGNVSLLSIGSMTARIDDSELKQYVLDSLQERSNSVTNNSEAVTIIDAMGNSADLAFTETLVDKLSGDSVAVRRHAAMAISKLPTEQAADALLTQLGNEENPRVTTTLFKALQNTGTNMDKAIPILSERLTLDNDKQRVAIVDLLGSQNTDTARKLLAEQFKRETNARIQQRIGRYVPAAMLK